MMSRGPDFEEIVGEMYRSIARITGDVAFANEERARHALDTLAAETGKPPTVSAKQMVEFHKAGAYTINVHRNASLRAMLVACNSQFRTALRAGAADCFVARLAIMRRLFDAARFAHSARPGPAFHSRIDCYRPLDVGANTAAYFAQMDWVVYHAPESSAFITTDVPIVVMPPPGYPDNRGVGIATAGARKYFPPSKNACLGIYAPGSMIVHRVIDKATVRALNTVVTVHADRLVISADELQLRAFVSRSGLAEHPPIKRFRVL
jgi:hypothetical protein